MELPLSVAAVYIIIAVYIDQKLCTTIFKKKIMQKIPIANKQIKKHNWLGCRHGNLWSYNRTSRK
jgi:hypothetical protein